MYNLRLISMSNSDLVTDIKFNSSINIYDVLVSNNLVLSNASCGGNHRCLKCLVYVKGLTLTPSDEELKALNSTSFESINSFGRARLACFCIAIGDCEVYYSGAEVIIPLTENTALKPNRIGVAVDIGTTTLEILFVDLDTATVIYSYRELNNQKAFGSDVLSRIEYSNKMGFKSLSKVISEQISKIIVNVIGVISVDLFSLESVYITGNTTMLHFFCNLDPKGIGVYPFTPNSLFGFEIPSNILPLFSDSTNIYVVPCIGPYIGADIVCGLLYTNMMQSDEPQLLIDIGTNGEIALTKNKHIYCCSTAAGPAFEGGEITNGMVATSGAIESVWMDDSKICYITVDGSKPTGICGTGIISAVETLLYAGVIDSTGRILLTGHSFTEYIFTHDSQPAVYISKDSVYITQKDIRNIQLAKSAIIAGIYTLLHETSTDVKDIKRIYLSGGFGNGINPESAVKIGLIPYELKEKVVAIGNSALQGVLNIMLSVDGKTNAEDIVDNASELSLSTSSYFMDKYVENMSFL